MKLDGSGRQVLDPSGSGPQMSPDGRLIVYHKQGSITLMNFATRSTQPFLPGDAAAQYTSLDGNFAWSHDSRSVVFKARRRDGRIVELAVADVDSTEGITAIKAMARLGTGFEDTGFQLIQEQDWLCLSGLFS